MKPCSEAACAREAVCSSFQCGASLLKTSMKRAGKTVCVREAAYSRPQHGEDFLRTSMKRSGKAARDQSQRCTREAVHYEERTSRRTAEISGLKEAFIISNNDSQPADRSGRAARPNQISPKLYFQMIVERTGDIPETFKATVEARQQNWRHGRMYVWPPYGW